jgi:hypothetical protein
VADVDEIRPQYQDSTVGAQAVFTSSLVRTVGPSIGGTIDQLDNLSVSEVGGSKELADPWYSDQILPFDVTIAGTNEYGAMAAAKIFSIEILKRRLGLLDRRRRQRDAGDLCWVCGWANAGLQDLVPPSPRALRLLPITAPTGNGPLAMCKSSVLSHTGR